MFARGLRRAAAGMTKFGGGQHSTIEQRRQHVGAGGVSAERGDFGRGWLYGSHTGEDWAAAWCRHRATLRNRPN
jgi:hypothetical protein